MTAMIMTLSCTIVLVGWLVGAALIAAVAGVIIYKRFSPKQEHQAGSATFSLADLRRLRDEGQITEEEFQKARGRVIGENRDMADEGTEV